MKICDAYGIDYNLLAASKQSTFENKSKGERQTYQNTIVPDWKEREGGLNQLLDTENRSWEIVGSYDHLPVFQEDLSQKSQAVNTMVQALSKAYEDGAISLEQYQEQLKKFDI